MSKLLATMKNGIANFAGDEEGAQIVEYALIIAVISVTLILALQALGGVNMSGFITRVTTCLTTAVCT